MTSLPMTVLQATRNRVGVSRFELAKRVGVTERTIARYEKGDTTPTSEMLTTIAHALGIDPRELVA